MKKTFLHLSELQFFAKRDTIIVLNDNSFIGTFESAFEAKEYAIKNKLQYKEITNECIIEKY